MPYSAPIIAYDFVVRGIKESNPVTQMKLQKLVFFAHGLHLAKYEQPLVTERFQAWKYGPVVPAIYHEYKLYGSAPILDTDYLSLFGEGDKYAEEIKTLDETARKAIEITWEGLKDANAIQLSNWTHKEGSPWANHYIAGVSDIVIPNDEIKQYFKAHITKS